MAEPIIAGQPVDAAPVLLYDGNCGFCAASVQFVLRHERRHYLRFAPLDGTFAAGVRARHPELNGVDSLIWVQPAPGMVGEFVLARSAAILRAASYIGGIWGLVRVAGLIPRALLDAGYDLFARHRHRIIPPPDQCYVPPADVRSRFLD
ncbi:MAG: DCC1-like thiol-disulfide oxidoreductase family protein [Vicinamibacterales bacterium]